MYLVLLLLGVVRLDQVRLELAELAASLPHLIRGRVRARARVRARVRVGARVRVRVRVGVRVKVRVWVGVRIPYP